MTRMIYTPRRLARKPARYAWRVVLLAASPLGICAGVTFFLNICGG